jgi:hypothetical protein
MHSSTIDRVRLLSTTAFVYGDDYKLEYPTGSGQQHTLVEIAEDIARRLVSLFLPDKEGRRPSHGREERYATDPYWKDLILFSEYLLQVSSRSSCVSPWAR